LIKQVFKKPGYIPEVVISGNIEKDKGVFVSLPNDHDVIKIGNLIITNVFVPITIISGSLFYDKCTIFNYGGDAIDVWGGRIRGKYTIVRDNKPTRPYTEYHQDFLQIDGLSNWKKDPYKTISGIVLKHLDVKLQGKYAQGIVLTGKNNTENCEFGSESLKFHLDGYPHLVNGSQLSKSIIGGYSNDVNGDVYIQNRNNRNKHKTHKVVSSIKVNPYSSLGVKYLNPKRLTKEEFLQARRILL